MAAKWLGLLIGTMTCACSGTSLEIGVLDSSGGGGSATKGSSGGSGSATKGGTGSVVAKGGSATASNDPEVAGATTTTTTGGVSDVSGGAGSTISPEDDGADCSVGALPGPTTLPTIEKLPDPFENLDGSAVTTKADWRCRRAEIKKQAETYVLGAKPPPPQLVSGSVTDSLVTVNVSDHGKSVTFSATVKVPSSGHAPFPVIIGFGGNTLDQGVLNAEGVATIAFDVADVGVGSSQRGANQQGAFYDLYDGGSATGLLVAWAWGASRIIDVLEQSGDGVLDSRAVGVTGCSRFGKGSFIAGAFDQRIALTLPMESGSAGVPVWRGIAQAEGDADPSQSLSSAFSEQPWFADAFQPFLSAATKIPIDTHELAALVAPRGLLIFDNPYIGLLSPSYGHLAALGGAEVYKALGAEDAIGYLSDVASGTHCALRSEWQAPLQAAIRRFLKHTGTAPGEIRAKPGAAADLADWREWTTPTLE